MDGGSFFVFKVWMRTCRPSGSPVTISCVAPPQVSVPITKSPASGLLKLVKARVGLIRLIQERSKSALRMPGLQSVSRSRQYACHCGVSGLRAPE